MRNRGRFLNFFRFSVRTIPILLGFAHCVSDPDHQPPPRPLEVWASPPLAPIPRPSSENRYSIVVVGNKVVLKPAPWTQSGVDREVPAEILIGSLIKDREDFFPVLALDKRRTGEKSYVFLPYRQPSSEWDIEGKTPLGAHLLGDLWRGDPEDGGTLLVQGLSLSQISRYKFETKRPVPPTFRNKVYALIGSEFEMVAIPLFESGIQEPGGLRLRLRELRGQPKVRPHLIEGAHLLVFEKSSLDTLEGPEQPLIRAKVRIRGKFYTSTFEKVSTSD